MPQSAVSPAPRRTVTHFARFRSGRRWSNTALKQRVQELMLRDLRCIFADEFSTISVAKAVDPDESKDLYRPLDGVSPKTLRGLPSYLAALYTVPLMSPYGEQFLFRRLNYLLHWSFVLRERLGRAVKADPNGKNVKALVETIDGMLAQADWDRSRVTQCNLRLVVSISRRFADNKQGFEELVSEGNLILMKAVDRFDYSRGFRFSTYATHAVQRHIFRLFQNRQKRRQREQITADEVLGDLLPPSQPDLVIDSPQREVGALVNRWDEILDDREKYVISARFGLAEVKEPRTLRDLSGELGISKERVRQVQIRAMDKLQEFAEAEQIGLEFKPLEPL